MPSRFRHPRIQGALVATVGVTVALGVTPVASAEPCSGAAAAIQPPAGTAAAPALPGPERVPLGVPRGHRPAGAVESAPKPKPGKLRAILDALTPQSERVQQQAAVQPVPQPPQAVVAPNPPPPDPAPAPAPPGTSIVGWVTGPDSPNDTVGRFAITGTDLGIMWDNGDPVNRQVLMAFGDTYGYCGVRGQQWRYNTLFRSQDGSLSRTVAVGNGAVGNKYSGSPVWGPGLSKQIVNSTKWADTERGIIPTAGIAVGNTQYLNYMSIKSWDSDGRWTTNYSAIAVSPDNGENWGVYPGSVRPAAPGALSGGQYLAGNENFQQGAFLRPGPGDPYLYTFGTPAGRGGSAYVARVPAGALPDLNRYEYWSATANAWVPRDPSAATPVIPGPVGEMSAQFNTHLNQYLVLYGNGANDVVARAAPAPQGPWGPERVLVRAADIPGGIYAPYLHPWSTGKELYYNLSVWSDYNVMLMRTVLP